MILIDQLRLYPCRRQRYAHAVSTISFAHLHEQMRQAQVPRHWFHRDHYDLNPTNYQRALDHGAQLATSQFIVDVLRLQGLR